MNRAKPTALKVLAGNPGHRPLNENEPKPPRSSLAPPAGLEGEALRQWDIMAPQLIACGVLTEIDRDALHLYCESYSRWADATDQVKRFGAVVKSDKGFPCLSPYLKVAQTEGQFMHKMMSEFGMTPSSRTKINAEPPKAVSGIYDNLNH